jgi:glycosyltransferase involved in cell wall biosynthesis
MKLTFVLPYAGLQGGIRVIGLYAERLTRRGHDVRLVSTPQVFSRRSTLKSLVLGRGLPRAEPSYLDRIGIPHKVLDSVRPVTDADIADGDVVIATYYTTARGVLELSPSKGAKVIFIQNYEVEEGKPNPTLDATWRMPMHKVVISRWLEQLAHEKFGDQSCSLVPNSVDLNQFHAPPRQKNAVPTIGLVYSRFSMKGYSTSLKALKQVEMAFPSVRLVCFGAERPDFRLPLPRFAEYYYRPPQDKLRELYAQCDVWICGSIAEGFSLPLLEAMACRCPAVSTRCGGPMDFIEDGVNGYLVDVRDDKALAERILNVLSLSADNWKRMSDAAYFTATRFTWDDATGLFEEALRRAVERSHPGTSGVAGQQTLHDKTRRDGSQVPWLPG